jgi:hypothetical protein
MILWNSFYIKSVYVGFMRVWNKLKVVSVKKRRIICYLLYKIFI